MLFKQLSTNVIGLVSSSLLDQIDHAAAFALICAEDLLDFETTIEAIWQPLFSVDDELVCLTLLHVELMLFCERFPVMRNIFEDAAQFLTFAFILLLSKVVECFLESDIVLQRFFGLPGCLVYWISAPEYLELFL